MAIPNPNPNIADGIKSDNKTYSSNKIESLIKTATELPIPEDGDAGKVLTVNSAETGYELTTPVDYSSDIEAVDDKLDYSATETEVGTWIDGKTIYRRVIDIGALPNNDTKEVKVFDKPDPIDTVVRLYGVAKNSSNVAIPLPHTSVSALTGQVVISYSNDANTTFISISTGSDRSGFSGFVVIEYTKA